ncbi:MAG: DUF1206 domain-containing protein [Acidimicrobiales bacterium]
MNPRPSCSAWLGQAWQPALSSGQSCVWAVLAYLTVDIAVSGAPGKSASAGGAIQQVAREPPDQAVLVVLAAGMIA